MIEFFALFEESPYIFAVTVISLVIIMYVVVRVVLHTMKKRHPGKYLSHLLWKMNAKRGKDELKTVDAVYTSVMDSLRKEGILAKKDKNGLLSRRKVLAMLPEGEKKQLLASLFELYEAKEYGNRRISNEAKVVSGILDRYANI
jgi:hypothetical protein